MNYPCIKVDLDKIEDNARFIVDKCKENGIDVYAVTKVFCGNVQIAKAALKGGVIGLADSRVENLKKFEGLSCEKLLLRLPMKSQVQEVVKYADTSLNSEIETIRLLDEEAERQGKVHNIILMIDLGDLREGVWEDKVMETAEEIVKLKNIGFGGIGVNLTCYGGVMPDDVNLGKLISFKEEIEKEFEIQLKIVSGGNSSSLYKVFDGSVPEGINMLRIGETIVLGRETAFGEAVEGMHLDAFRLQGEIVEMKRKPSLPIGKIGMDAFGNTPSFEDRGEIIRAIVALGRQDVNIDGLEPYDSKISILGGSSDHLLLDITEVADRYKIGSVVEFNVDYGALLGAYTSEYIQKR